MVNHELSRVPQGSVLIPQIFLLFIKDMPVIATNTTTLFANGSKFQGTQRNHSIIVTLLIPMQGAGPGQGRSVLQANTHARAYLRNWQDFFGRFSVISKTKSHSLCRDLTLYSADLFLSFSLLYRINSLSSGTR